MMISGVFLARSPTPAMSIFSAPNQVSGNIELRIVRGRYTEVIADGFKLYWFLLAGGKTG